MTSLRRSGHIVPGLFIIGLVLVLAVLTAGCTQQTVTPQTTTVATTPAASQIANPASVNCGQIGGTTEIKTDATGGQYGMCNFGNGTSCEEWALFRGEGCKAGVAAVATTAASAGMANPASVACVNAGGKLEIKKNADGGEYGMCTFTNGTSCEEWALFRGEGCKTGVTAAATTAATDGKKMVTLTEADKGKSEDIAQGTRFAVQLKENPTTGFAWNATVSSGLEIQSSDYQMDSAAPGMVGVGGIHTWVIIAKDTGNQKFSATYGRSWEKVTGNETAFSANINVVKI
jgi:putative hemolysin/predicted secreted protein